MDYLIVENKQIVLLGPTPWRQRFMQREFDDLEVPYTVPPIEQGYVKVTNQIEIFPLLELSIPDHNPLFEQLAGPFYTFNETDATGTYSVLDQPIDIIKQNMKNIVAAERYKKENIGLQITVKDQSVFLDTSRSNRDIFVQKYLLMGDNDTVNWKFPETWLELTKTDLGSVIAQGATYVQGQFDWEKSTAERIDAATSIEELKLINLN